MIDGDYVQVGVYPIKERLPMTGKKTEVIRKPEINNTNKRSVKHVSLL